MYALVGLLLSLFCARDRVSRPLRSYLTLNNARWHYFGVAEIGSIFNGKRWHIGQYIVLKSNSKSSTSNSFMWFPPYFYFRFGRRRWSRVVYRRFLSTVTSNCQPCVTYGTTLLSVLSVMLVYCGQTFGWIRLSLGTEVGLGPGDIVLDPPLVGSCLLWRNGRPCQSY